MLSVEDLMARFNVARATVWRWCRKKAIPCVKIGRRYLFEEKDVENWVKNKRGF